MFMGDYRKYLYEFRLEEPVNCPKCAAVSKAPQYITFYCPRFKEGGAKVGMKLETKKCIKSCVFELGKPTDG